MSRVLKSLVIFFLAASIVAISAGYLILRSSVLQLDGEISVTGLNDSVSVERDAAGIPTITVAVRNDMAFGTGFVHGQDLFLDGSHALESGW